jgi:hypothetical protein
MAFGSSPKTSVRSCSTRAGFLRPWRELSASDVCATPELQPPSGDGLEHPLLAPCSPARVSSPRGHRLRHWRGSYAVCGARRRSQCDRRSHARLGRAWPALGHREPVVTPARRRLIRVAMEVSLDSFMSAAGCRCPKSGRRLPEICRQMSSLKTAARPEWQCPTAVGTPRERVPSA